MRCLENKISIVYSHMTENSSNSSGANLGNTKQISPSKCWVFTWNNYPENFESVFSSKKDMCDKYVYQQEIGDKEGTKHLQGFIKFSHKCRPKNLFDKAIHWEKCRNEKAAIRYCQKEETREGECFRYNVYIEEPLKIIENLRDWQTNIINICKSTPDDRTIYWFWESKGGIGKTALCKYICVNFNCLYLSGKSADCKYAIAEFYENNMVYPNIVIFDIPRCSLEYISFEAIEKIKDGIFFSGKYKSTMCIYNCPHVFVFANEPPKYELLSNDRWKVTNIRA